MAHNRHIVPPLALFDSKEYCVDERNRSHSCSNDIIEQPTRIENLTHRFSTFASEFINSSINENKPFFVYAAHHLLHAPLLPGPAWQVATVLIRAVPAH